MAFTYFFRDLQTLELICSNVLPVLKTKKNIKIWDAGCAMGPEPFTLAMLIREEMGHMYFRNIDITATDIDISDTFGSKISNATYPLDMVQRIEKKYIDKYFTKNPNSTDYSLNDEIKKRVSFIKHDLLTYKSVASEFGLIICKNVLLHFSEDERLKVFKMFYRSLSSDGFMALEQTQKLPREMESFFEKAVPNAQIYRKV